MHIKAKKVSKIYLRCIHHTDVPNIAIAEAEENVNDNENNITLKDNTRHTPTLWANVAQKKKRNKSDPKERH